MKFVLDRTLVGNPKCSAEAALLVYTMVGSREDVPSQVRVRNAICFFSLLLLLRLRSLSLSD
jgi:hypothetical protein